MTKNEALQHGLGYACGREDVSGDKTISAHRDSLGWIEFGEAYAAGWDDYNAGVSHYMVNARDAYATWQASSGRTIFREGTA